MKHVYSKLAIALFGFAALSSYAQTDNTQSVTVNGKIVNSATDGGESVQTISGKKSAVVNGTVITHNGETTYIPSGGSSSDKVNAALGGQDFSGQDLAGQSFTNSDLANANFSNANLQGADFTNTNLSGANFHKANLKGANLTNSNLAGADLTGANLKGAIKTNINTRGAKTKGAIWR